MSPALPSTIYILTVYRGGDYGFAWTPHGTYARDLEHFVKLLDFTPMESILAATAGVAKLFMREDELGKIQPGFFADCVLVDGDPLKDIAVLQDHSKLNVIMINGRIHKASYKEFLRTAPQQITPVPQKLTNFTAYQDERGQSRIGHLNLEGRTIVPLAMPSGAPLSSLYEVIELGGEMKPTGEAIPVTSVKLLPPLSGRDVLAVGKNYSEHAKEFNASGYDASDKADQPSHPVIFTKRSTSIIASGDDIHPHSTFTQTLDYEGEIGVIIGKAAFQVHENDAMSHVWGYTIINDVTAREKQRDHKQFYIGKSADTFCPMGPIAVPASSLPSKLQVQTYLNGSKKQEGSFPDDLIFSTAKLISTISEGATLRPGDVIATGTPAGVGFGQSPPTFMQPGDEIKIVVPGLGELVNKVSSASSENSTASRVTAESVLPTFNLSRTHGAGLTSLSSGKTLHVETYGSGTEPIVFVHGLGGSTTFYHPLLSSLSLKDSKSHKSILFDLEGHGLSPTSAQSVISIQSYAGDISSLLSHLSITQPITLVAHSMGCLIALTYALQHSDKVKQLILLGPPPSPLPAAAAEAQRARATAVRKGGMKACADAVTAAGTSQRTQTEKPVATAAVRGSLLSQDPEGYAKGCTALGESEGVTLGPENLPTSVDVLMVTGR